MPKHTRPILQTVSPGETEPCYANERGVIGSLLERPALAANLGSLSSGDFASPAFRVTYTAIQKIISEGRTIDLNSVVAEISHTIDFAPVVDCVHHGIIPENFEHYKRAVINSSLQRQVDALAAVFGTQTDPVERGETLERMQTLHHQILRGVDDNGWRGLFHTRAELETIEPIEFRIDNFLQADGLTFIAALAGHGKTMLMLSMVKALLEGTPLFGHELFSVPCPAKRVLYLTPENSCKPFNVRLQKFRLQKFGAERFFVRTLSLPGDLKLDDVRLLKAAEGADVFIDTAVRFSTGDENSAQDNRPFADLLFRLLNAGARSICGAHHSPKAFSNQESMTLENVLRGSGDIGAMLCSCWGLRQIDPSFNRIFVANCKARDFQSCPPFILEGRPHIDRAGDFKISAAPGTTGELKDYCKHSGGRPATSDKDQKLAEALELRATGMSDRDIAEKLGLKRSTLQRWLFDADHTERLSDD